MRVRGAAGWKKRAKRRRAAFTKKVRNENARYDAEQAKAKASGQPQTFKVDLDIPAPWEE